MAQSFVIVHMYLYNIKMYFKMIGIILKTNSLESISPLKWLNVYVVHIYNYLTILRFSYLFMILVIRTS